MHWEVKAHFHQGGSRMHCSNGHGFRLGDLNGGRCPACNSNACHAFDHASCETCHRPVKPGEPASHSSDSLDPTTSR